MAKSRFRVKGTLTGTFDFEVEAESEDDVSSEVSYFFSNVGQFDVNLIDDSQNFEIDQIEKIIEDE